VSLIYETQEQLDAALLAWKKRLRLQDWAIRAELVSPRELEGSRGRVQVFLPLKEAGIRIGRQHNDPEYDIRGQDHEVALVHELVHIHTEPFWPKKEGLKWDMAEQAVNDLSWALVNLARAKND
jgi:hypothetical protein